jgi:hypothetical protein
MWISIVLCLHLLGLGLGVGGGIALSQVGPRLVSAPPEQRELLWALERFFGRVGAGGLLVLLITGPLMLWLKFGGPSGLTWWFTAKMVFVCAAIVGVAVHEWAGRRFRGGDVGAVRWMFIGGRTAGMGIVLAVLCAALTFG